MHRVLEPRGVLPQAAQRLDTDPVIRDDEVRVRVERLNLDAASFRQLETKHGGDGDAVRAEVLEIVRSRGKMHNPVTGSGGMLVGTVEEVGEGSPLGLAVGDRIATLVSLTLTPLVIEDGLARWDGRSEQVPADGYAILFGRRIAAKLPEDLPRCSGPLGDGRLRSTGADRAPCRAVRLDRLHARAPGGRGHRRGRQVRLPVPGRSPSCRRPTHPGRRTPPGRGRPARPHGARSRAGRPGARLRRPRPGRAAGRRGGGRGACRPHHRVRRRPGLRGRRHPGARPTAAPSSSSRWPRRSARPRSAPRAWPPT